MDQLRQHSKCWNKNETTKDPSLGFVALVKVLILCLQDKMASCLNFHPRKIVLTTSRFEGTCRQITTRTKVTRARKLPP